MAGIEHLKQLLSDVVAVGLVAVKETKEFADISAEIKDLDTAEVIALVSQVIMVEIPKVISAIKEPKV